MDRAYKEYSFIARVKVLKKLPLDKLDSGLVHNSERMSHYSKVSVEIIELYKGTAEIMILEWGVGSSCDMGLRENDEWILFGNYINKIFVSVSYCNPWLFLKNAAGEREWLYDSGLKAAKQLRKIAGLPEKTIPDKRVISYYPDGKILANEEYKNGMLQGNRKVYFSNGLLMEEGDFTDGVSTGKHNKYTRNGQLINEFTYVNGEITHSVFWYDTSWQVRRMDDLFENLLTKPDTVPPAVIQAQSEGWFDPVKKSRHSFVYNRKGKIEREYFAFSDEAIKISYEYFETGKLQFEGHYFKEGDISYEKRWDESGNIISDRKWIKSKLVEDAVKK
ncbi:MAG: hypothetical protein H7Y01_11500 [Ferruginibacter sp.]|nr:hypothetical protein [Chitinophagaceae bacterium]